MKHILFFVKGRIHVCETPKIAQAVVGDMEKRGCKLGHRLDVDADIHIDFGGAIIENCPYQRPVSNVTFFDQHYSFVCSAVEKAKSKGDRGGYFKIHGVRAICLTPETFGKLVEFLQVNKERLMMAEATQAEVFFERMAKLKQDSPHIL